MRQAYDLKPKKLPSQDRSRATFDALVEACARLLPRLGYAGVTTNHIATEAGVGIASLYEYFPGKDAIVAEVARRLVERVLARLDRHMATVVDESETHPRPVRRWIELVYATLSKEKRLVAVLTDEVPYTNQVDAVRASRTLLIGLSDWGRERAGVRFEDNAATLHLLLNLVSSTILQLVLDPPTDTTTEAMIEALTTRIEAWLAEG